MRNDITNDSSGNSEFLGEGRAAVRTHSGMFHVAYLYLINLVFGKSVVSRCSASAEPTVAKCTPYPINSHFGNTKHSGNLSPGRDAFSSEWNVVLDYVVNLFVGKLSGAIGHSTSWLWKFKSSFFKSVLCIIGARSKEQMFGITAAPVIAGMADIHSIGYRSEGVEYPSDSMGGYGSVVGTQLSISVAAETRNPWPTLGIGKNPDFWPESLRRFDLKTFVRKKIGLGLGTKNTFSHMEHVTLPNTVRQMI